MSRSIERLRRDARALKAAFESGDREARLRINAHRPRPEGAVLEHADCLHVIARERRFDSWPQLKFAVESHGMDRAERQQRLGIAIRQGQDRVVKALLAEDPDLPRSRLDLACSFYLADEVARRLPRIRARRRSARPWPRR